MLNFQKILKYFDCADQKGKKMFRTGRERGLHLAKSTFATLI